MINRAPSFASSDSDSRGFSPTPTANSWSICPRSPPTAVRCVSRRRTSFFVLQDLREPTPCPRRAQLIYSTSETRPANPRSYCSSPFAVVSRTGERRPVRASMREDDRVLFDRSGLGPSLAATARVAPSAQLAGDVRVGELCVIDHGAVLLSSGPPVVIGAGSVVMANAVIRSAGGTHRPAFRTIIGEDVLVG